MIGIYGIRNIVNNKIYIGSSNNIERRWKRHTTELNNKKHSNKYLEQAYHKYGSDNFDFIIIEICEENMLIEKEIFHIQQYKSLNTKFGYNLKLPQKHASLVSSTIYSQNISKRMKGIKPSNFEEMQKNRWRTIEVYKNGNLYGIYESLRKVEVDLGIPRGNVYNYLKGKTPCIKHFKEYHFQYA